jgi:hypothetical protein
MVATYVTKAGVRHRYYVSTPFLARRGIADRDADAHRAGGNRAGQAHETRIPFARSDRIPAIGWQSLNCRNP